MRNKELTSSNKDTIIISMEKLCNVIQQKIKKSQGILSMKYIDDVRKSYLEIISVFPQLKTELSETLIGQYNYSLNISTEMGLDPVSDKIRDEIDFIQKTMNDE